MQRQQGLVAAGQRPVATIKFKQLPLNFLFKFFFSGVGVQMGVEAGKRE